MRAVLVALVAALVFVLRSRVSLHLEVLTLRHQLAVLQGGGRQQEIIAKRERIKRETLARRKRENLRRAA